MGNRNITDDDAVDKEKTVPVYEYNCEDCEEHVIEKSTKLKDYKPIVEEDCPECEEKTKHRRMPSKTSFQVNFRRVPR